MVHGLDLQSLHFQDPDYQAAKLSQKLFSLSVPVKCILSHKVPVTSVGLLLVQSLWQCPYASNGFTSTGKKPQNFCGKSSCYMASSPATWNKGIALCSTL